MKQAIAGSAGPPHPPDAIEGGGHATTIGDVPGQDLYAPYNVPYQLMAQARERTAADLLHKAGAFPRPGNRCLEIGYGRIGLLGMLVSWGLREADLHGIEIDATRAAVAQAALPTADLRVGSATSVPWPDATFDLVVSSTVFSSIREPAEQRAVAEEIVRVLAPGGALLWYDMAWNSPRNPNVSGVTRRQLKALFPQLRGVVRSATLAPPLSRLVASRSWLAATALDTMRIFRSHLVAVLVKR